MNSIFVIGIISTIVVLKHVKVIAGGGFPANQYFTFPGQSPQPAPPTNQNPGRKLMLKYEKYYSNGLTADCNVGNWAQVTFLYESMVFPKNWGQAHRRILIGEHCSVNKKNTLKIIEIYNVFSIFNFELAVQISTVETWVLMEGGKFGIVSY